MSTLKIQSYSRIFFLQKIDKILVKHRKVDLLIFTKYFKRYKRHHLQYIKTNGIVHKYSNMIIFSFYSTNL